MNNLTRRKILFYLAGIFLAGVVSGSVITWGSTRRTVENTNASVDRVCQKVRTELKTRLNLSFNQQRAIDSILERTARDLRAIHSKTAADVHHVFQRSNAEIAQKLSPEQQKRFDEYNQERRERWEKRKREDASRENGEGKDNKKDSIPSK